jgi:hypothetical protein
MTEDTWSRLDAVFAEFPALKAEPVPAGEVAAASARLGRSFPDDYSLFIARYGSAIVGPYPVFGLRPAEPLGNDWSVIDINRRYRADKWPGVEDWLIFSADNSRNPVGFDSAGRVLLSDHDLGDTTVVAEGFEDSLPEHCLRDS